MAVCPHTHPPRNHEASVVRRSVGMLCGTCRGALRECGSCGAILRSAARFCTACGTRLTDEPDERQSLPPGRIRDAIAATRPRSLRHGAVLAEGEQPFLWRVCDLGILAFSSRSNAAPTRVAHVDLLDSGRSRDLTASWPAADTWLVEPIISAHGAFAVTASGIHGLAFHGFDTVGEVVVWRPPAGEVATAFLDDGCCVALVLAPDGSLSAYAGNGQAENWKRRWTLAQRQDLTQPVLAGAIPPGPGRSTEGIWLLTGDRLLVVDGQTGAVRITLDARDCAPVSSFVNRRLGTGQFEPVVLGSQSGTPQLALSVRGAAPSVGILPLRPTAALHRIADIGPTGWLVPHPEGSGIMVGNDSTLRIFAESDVLATYELRGSRFSLSPALSGGSLISVVERQSRPGLPAEAELVMLTIPALGPATVGDIRVVLREPLPGAAVPCLPPILAGHSVLVALEDHRGDIMVHSFRIHEAGEGQS